MVPDFRVNTWVDMSFSERLEVLNNFERLLAQQELREPYNVVRIPEEDRVIQDGKPKVRGQTDHLKKQIQIDQLLLSENTLPYQALETYFHEARHAYQYYAIQNPGFHDNEEQVADWRKNLKGGYIDREDIEMDSAKFSHYRWQPVEADARRVARTRADELYIDTYKDDSQYNIYKVDKEKSLTEDRERAIEELKTEYYEEEARWRMLTKHEAVHDIQIDSAKNVTIEVENEQTMNPTSPTNDDLEEGYDYSYGQGY